MMQLTRSFGALRRRGRLAEAPSEDDDEVRPEGGSNADIGPDVNTSHDSADEDGGTQAAA